MTESNFAHLEARVGAIETGLAANTAMTQKIASDVAEGVEFLNAAKGAMRVLEIIGKMAKPMGYIVALCAAVAGFWTALKGSK